MPTTIDIPDVGLIDFPDSMAESDIQAAVRKLVGFRKPAPQSRAGTPLISQTATIAAQPPSFLERAYDVLLGPGTALGGALGTSGEPVSAQRAQGPAPFLRFENLLTGAPETAAEGATRGAAQFASGLTSPQTMLLIAGSGGLGALGTQAGKTIVPKLISLGFGADMISNALEQVPEFQKAFDEGDVPEMARLLTQISLTSAMAGAAVRHARAAEPTPTTVRLRPLPPEDAGPAPSGLAHPAAEAAQTLFQIPDVKSARDSARVFEAAAARGELPTPRRMLPPPEDVPRRPDVFTRTAQLGPIAETIPERTLGRSPLQKQLQEQLGPLASTLPSELTRADLPLPIREAMVPKAAAKRRRRQKGAVTVDARAIRDFAQDVRTEWFDRFDPIRQLVQGKSLSPAQDPYVAAREYAGHIGLVDNRLADLRRILQPVAARKLDKELAEHALHDSLIEEAGLGAKKFPGGKTLEEIRKEKADLEAALTPEEIALVQRAEVQLQMYSERLIREARDAGTISDRSYRAMLAKREKYMPLQRLDFLSQELEGGRIDAGSNALSVASQKLVQRRNAEGSTREILNPLEGMIRNTYRAISDIARNRVALRMADLADRPEFAGQVVRIRKGSPVPEGMETFTALRDGKAEQYAAPKAVVEAMKGMRDEQVDMATRLARMSTRALRAGATSLNLAFFIPNTIRDAQTAKLVSEVGFSLPDWARGFWHGVRRGDVYEQYLENFGGFSGFYERQGGTRSTLKHLTESTGKRAARKVVNPVELMRIVGESFELAPRLGVFERGLRKGLAPEQAAFNARNSTIDFARMGTKMRVANMWVPFLNARLQGTVNAFGSLRRDPVRGGMIVGYTVALPAAATYLHNRLNYPDVLDDIAQYERDSNFVFIYGDEKDEKGNYKQVLKIPKGDIGRIFGNPVENMLEWYAGTNPKGARELFLEIASDVSPVDFEREGELSFSRAGSSLLPPGPRGLLENFANRSFYFDRPIVPRSLEDAPPSEQFTASTPPWLVGLTNEVINPVAQIAGTEVSPLQVGNVVEAQFGGVGRQFTRQELPTSAVLRRFLGARGGEEENRLIKITEELATKEAGERASIYREAETLYERLKKIDDPVDRRKQFQQAIQDSSDREGLIARFDRVVERDQLGLSSFERVLDSQSVAVRAQMAVRELQKLPPEKRLQRYRDWQRKKIITPAVENAIEALLSLQ